MAWDSLVALLVLVLVLVAWLVLVALVIVLLVDGIEVMDMLAHS
jgi:hypothetical protein